MDKKIPAKVNVCTANSWLVEFVYHLARFEGILVGEQGAKVGFLGLVNNTAIGQIMIKAEDIKGLVVVDDYT